MTRWYHVLNLSFVTNLLRYANQKTLYNQDALPLDKWCIDSLQHTITTSEITTNGLFMIIWNKFRWRVLGIIVPDLLYYTIYSTIPFSLQQIILFLNDENTVPWNGVRFALLLSLAVFVSVFCTAIKYYHIYNLSTTIRAILINSIYNHCLVEVKCSDTTQVVQLIQHDCTRVLEAINFLSVLFVSPIVLLVSLGLLYWQIGLAGVAAIILMFILVPIQIVISTAIGRYRTESVKHTDLRVSMMREVLSGIRIVRLFSWMQSLSEHIDKIRCDELACLKTVIWLKSINLGIVFVYPSLVTYVTFLSYTLWLQKEVVSSDVFVVMSFLTLLRFPILLLPQAITNTLDGKHSLKRIESFLSLSTKTDKVYDLEQDKDCYRWSNDDPGISISESLIKGDLVQNALIGVIGSVGSGKSSLCLGLMHEMGRVCPHTKDQRFGYMDQKTWLQSGTIQENILFHCELDESKYNMALQCSSLQDDLLEMILGDQTQVGDQGSSLSGGQRARCAMARTLYHSDQSDIVIMDDPLAALDSRVAKLVFFNSIKQGPMIQKIRILILNSHLELLQHCTAIWVVKDGKVTNIPVEKQKTLTPIRSNSTKHLRLALSSSLSLPIFATSSPNYEYDPKIKSRSVSFDSHNTEKEEDEPEEIWTAGTHPKTVTKSMHERQTSKSTFHSPSIEPVQPSSEIPTLKQNQLKVVQDTTSTTSYIDYAKACCHSWLNIQIFMILLFILCCTGQLVRMIGDYWLVLWGSKYYDSPLLIIVSSKDDVLLSNSWWLSTWICFILGTFVIMFVRAWCIQKWTILASSKIHKKLVNGVLYASIYQFYDQIPLGKLLSLFSKDVQELDVVLPIAWSELLLYGFQFFGMMLLAIIVTLYFLPVVVIILIVFIILQRFFSSGFRQIKLLEHQSRGPIVSNLLETLNGLSTIRAYHLQSQFFTRFTELVEINTRLLRTIYLMERWLSLRSELCSFLTVFSVSLMMVLLKDTVSSSLSSLTLVYSLQMSGAFQWVVRQTIQVQTSMETMLRMCSFIDNAPQELDLIISKSNQKENLSYQRKHQRNPTWRILAAIQGFPNVPQTCFDNELNEQIVSSRCLYDIEFENVCIRYQQTSTDALSHVSFRLIRGERLGIVGRTGSGKSTLLLSLFRMLDPHSGTIHLFGQNISSLSRHKVRKLISVIPQDIVLFPGTVRFNLDPEGVFQDKDLLDSLERVGLKNKVTLDDDKLFRQLSLGQKQLFCVARVLLMKTNVIMLDEATASMDGETDELVQTILRHELRGKTTLTIAHRVQTILDYDRVAVMENGKIVELDRPGLLLRNTMSNFYSLCKEYGPQMMNEFLRKTETIGMT